MEQKTDRIYPSVRLEKIIDLEQTPEKKKEITRC